MPTVRVTLLSKPGCHLCDDAREAVEEARAELSADGVTTELEELDILQDPRLARLHAEEIPVLLIDGRRHSIWRVDPERFAAAVRKAAGRSRFSLRRG